MTVYAIGLNHHTAPVALREQLAFAVDQVGEHLTQLKTALSAEVALLSTCNRTELYFASSKAQPAQLMAQAAQWLASHKGLSEAVLKPHLYALNGTAPVRHAFRVACGLDSMVLGEPQILGQLKQAVRSAQEARTLGTDLHHVFQQSFAVAKEVRTHTGVGAASVSMAAAAVRLAQRIFGDISQRKVLMIGAGEMIELCAVHFAGHAPLQLDVANRTLARGEALCATLQQSGQKSRVISLAQVPDVMAQYDIVMSCTASTLPIIGLGMAQRAMTQRHATRRHQPMMMVDLAVPRDIESEVGQLPDVYLYTVDDLGKVVQEGRDSRAAAVVHAEKIIDLRVQDYQHWQARRRAVPVLKAMQMGAHSIRDAELHRALQALQTGISPQAALEQLSRQLTQKLLHGSLSLTQDVASRNDDALLARLETLHASTRKSTRSSSQR